MAASCPDAEFRRRDLPLPRALEGTGKRFRSSLLRCADYKLADLDAPVWSLFPGSLRAKKLAGALEVGRVRGCDSAGLLYSHSHHHVFGGDAGLYVRPLSLEPSDTVGADRVRADGRRRNRVLCLYGLEAPPRKLLGCQAAVAAALDLHSHQLGAHGHPVRRYVASRLGPRQSFP